MKNFSKFYIAVILILVSSFIFSNDSNAIVVSTSSTSFAKSQEVSQRQVTGKLDIQKTDTTKEITRRTDSLENLISRIQEMKILSAEDKISLINQIKEQINSLENLNNKISEDIDAVALKEHRRAVYDQYRIYIVFMPKIQILAASDRVIEICNDFSAFTVKIQERLKKASDNGKDTSSLQLTLTDLQKKLVDVKSQVESAQKIVIPLIPDNGDAAVFKSNQKALEDARAKLLLAKKDLLDAAKDIQTIRKGLAFFDKPKTATASSSSSVLKIEQ
jgi:hypothetical protein